MSLTFVEKTDLNVVRALGGGNETARIHCSSRQQAQKKAPEAAQAEISGGVVKLGVLTDETGLLSSPSGEGSIEATRMAVEDFGGKAAGKPIEIIHADHQNKTDIGAAIARRWIDVDGVDAIVDVPNSAIALAVQEIAKEKNRVLLVSTAATADLTGKACSPVGVHWTWDTYALAASAAKAIVQQGGDSWFFLTADYAFGHASSATPPASSRRAAARW